MTDADKREICNLDCDGLSAFRDINNRLMNFFDSKGV